MCVGICDEVGPVEPRQAPFADWPDADDLKGYPGKQK
jgi:hypothetical protein